jgi:T5orf172 domain
MGCVYCYRAGALNTFKVGLTTNAADKRMRNVQTGSWEELSIYRQIETDHALALERRIHKLLDSYRATKKSEYFHVTTDQLDKAIKDAQLFLAEYLPVVEQAKKLHRQKPTAEMIPRTNEIDEIYRDLKKAKQEEALLEQRIELLQGKLQVAIGKNAGIESIASWKWQERFAFDLVRFRTEKPEVFEQYQKSLGTRYFRLL